MRQTVQPAPPDRGDVGFDITLLSRALRGNVSVLEGDPARHDAIVAMAVDHGVDLVLWHELHDRLGATHPVICRVSPNVAPAAALAAVRDRELAGLIARFNALGIDSLVFKGAALAQTCYARPWLRPRIDTDVLVRREAFDRASLALCEAGYVRSETFSTGQFVSHQVAFERTDLYGVAHTIDLHWRVLNPQMLADVVDFEALREDARVVQIAGGAVRVPSPLWSLVLACAHRLGHHQNQERLIWLFDIHLLGGRLEPPDWPRLLRIARERRVSALCADGVAAASGHFGTPVPDDVIRRLADAGRDDVSRQYVARGVRRLDVLRDDLRRLPRWRDRVRLLKEHALPPAAFMRTRYGVSGVRLPFYYAHRLIAGAYKWIRT